MESLFRMDSLFLMECLFLKESLFLLRVSTSETQSLFLTLFPTQSLVLILRADPVSISEPVSLADEVSISDSLSF